jgi:hypothetical protein
MNVITFTKLGVVQLKVDDVIKDELPMEDFLQRLRQAIENDVSKHQVIENTNGLYEIFHNGKKYTVFYGKSLITKNSPQIDTVQILNELVELSKTQKRIQDFKEDIKEEKPRSLNEIVSNGNEGIFYSEDDKIKYIEYRNKKLKEEKVLEGLSKIFTDYNYNLDDSWDTWPALVGAIPGALVFVGSIVLGAILNSLWLLIPMAYGVIEAMVTLFHGVAPLSFLGQVALRGFVWLGHAASRISKRLGKRRRLAAIKKSIIEADLSETISEKAPERKERKISEKDKTLKGEAKESIKKIFSKLALLSDLDTKGTYASQLNEIIDLFKSVKPEEYNQGFSDVLYKLSYLDGQVSEDIRKEISTHAITSDYQSTKQLVDNISDEKFIIQRESHR